MTDLPNARINECGGSLYPDDPTYIERDADHELYEALQLGEFCYVFSSWQTGKSSLIARTLHRLLDDNFDCIYLDLSVREASIEPSQWYANIAVDILDGLQIEHEYKLLPSFELSPLTQLTQVVQKIILPAVDKHLVIFIDELDYLRDLKFEVKDFFSFIHSCHTQKKTKLEYKKLTFCVFGVEYLALSQRTPFNCGRSISLGNFKFEPAKTKLIPWLKGLNDPILGLREILEWTGGHPFLTKKVCRLVANAATENPEVSVSAVVRSTIIENWAMHDEPIHLRNIAEKIIQNERAVKLLELYQKVLNKNIMQLKKLQRIDIEKDLIVLLSLGIVVRDSKQLKVHNRIYREVFNQDWVEEEKANLYLRQRGYQGIEKTYMGESTDNRRKQQGVSANDGAIINIENMINNYGEPRDDE